MSSQELLLEKFYRYRKPSKNIFEQLLVVGGRLDEAVLGSIYKASSFLGPDDINFLQQFPRRYWKQALDKRYNNTSEGFQSLFNYLKDLQAKRDEVYKAQFDKHLEDERKQFGSPDYAGLSPKTKEELARKHARVLAKREAFDIVPTDKFPAADKDQVFEFKRKGAATEKYVADPMINSLVQKLEGTIDNEDGFDLSHPTVVEKKKGDSVILQNKTDGFNFPNFDTISEVLPEYLKLHAHGILKYDPEELENTKNLPDKRTENADGVSDNYTYKLALNDLIKKHKAILKRERPVEYKGSAVKLEKDAKLVAEAELKDLIRAGKIVTPTGEKLELDASGRVIHPDLFLPHKEVTIRKINSVGNEVEEKTMNPVVTAGHFYRRINPAESALIDKVQEAGGDLSKISEPERQQYEILSRKLRGMHYDISTDKVKPIYVNSHNEMDLKHGRQGSEHSRAGGFHPNQDSDIKIFLSKHGINRQKYNDKIATLFKDDPEGAGLKAEIRNEVDNQLLMSSKKDTFDTIVERMVLRGAVDQLTKIAFLKVLENLGIDGIELRTDAGTKVRRKMIKSIIDHLEQQDLGRGSRRTRVSRRIFFTGTIDDIKKYSDSVVCRPDKRRLGSSRCGFRYDLDELLDIGREAIALAIKASDAIDKQEDLSAEDLETEILQLKAAFEQGLMALELSYFEIAKKGKAEDLEALELEAFAQAKRQVEEFLNNLAKTSLSTKAMLGEIQNQVEKNVNIVKPPEEQTTPQTQEPKTSVPAAQLNLTAYADVKKQLDADPKNYDMIIKNAVEKMGKRYPDETPSELKYLRDQAQLKMSNANAAIDRMIASNSFFNINVNDLKIADKPRLESLYAALKAYVEKNPTYANVYNAKLSSIDAEIKQRG